MSQEPDIRVTENKMGTQPVGRLLAGMAIPMMISMLVQALYNIVDSVFVSRLSENALTAVSLAFPLQNLMIAVATGTGVGVNAALSRNLGEKNFDRANRIADHALFLAAMSYIVFAIFGLFFARQFFRLQTDIEEIVDLGTTYLRVCTIASFGLFMEIACERLLQSTGKTIYSMYTQGLGAIINIVLDPILIFGLIGFPNVGKSTLLSMVTNANPKIANYHFTTLAPNLGVVEGRFGDKFVMADIPGLVEGASEGVGLGHEFLRHVERTKVFIHVVDAAGVEGDDPVENVEKINRELAEYKEDLLKRPQVIAANKTDIPGSEENVARLKETYEPQGFKVFPISAATNKGLDELLTEVGRILREYPEDIVFEEEYEEYDEVKVDQEPFTIEEVEDGYFVVTGVGVEKMIGYTNIDTEKGFAFFQKYLKEKGIIEALEEKGIEEGDTVHIYDLDFEFWK